jgi:hypothetical protein
MILGFFQPNTRYRIVRAAQHLTEGEELTFWTITNSYDRQLGYPLIKVVFAEQDWVVYIRPTSAPEELEALEFPERFFVPIGQVDEEEIKWQLQLRYDGNAR